MAGDFNDAAGGSETSSVRVPQMARMVRWASWRVRLGRILGAPPSAELLPEDSCDHSSITVRTDWVRSSLVLRRLTTSVVVLEERSMVDGMGWCAGCCSAGVRWLGR